MTRVGLEEHFEQEQLPLFHVLQFWVIHFSVAVVYCVDPLKTFSIEGIERVVQECLILPLFKLRLHP